MIRWRCDIIGDDIAQGVELRFCLYGEEFKGGDGLYFVTLNSIRSDGMVINAEPTDAVITKGQGKWRIAKKSENIWDVAERVMRFEKQGLVKTHQALQRGIANPTEKLEAQNWVLEEEQRQQRQRSKHYRLLWALIMFAVIGAVAGAFAILKG
jgi:hypothetical protein